MLIDYVKQKIIFVRRQNPYRASKLTVKNYFSGIHAGISASRSVNLALLFYNLTSVLLRATIEAIKVLCWTKISIGKGKVCIAIQHALH